MSSRQVDPRKQFSKKLAGRAEWFWFFYMVLLVALVAYQPNVAMTAVYLASIVTIVMIVSVWAYTDNSKYEKGIWAANELAKIKLNKKTDSSSEEEEEDEDESQG